MNFLQQCVAGLNVNSNQYFRFLYSFIYIFFLMASEYSWANEKGGGLIKVTGTGFVDVVDYPHRGLTSKELVQAMSLARKSYPRYMSLEQLHSLADKMTLFYRDKGFKFHTVYLPPQKTKSGFIQFEVIEAKLGDIQVIGKGIDNNTIKSVFSTYLNQPLYQPDIDYAVLALKNQTGIDAVAYYSRGINTGEVRLNVKAKQDIWDAYFQVDNYGSKSTGEHRLTTGVNWYSPSGRLDKLSLGVMAANGDPDANLFGYLNYQLPLWNLDNLISINISNNLFSVGQDFASLELDGDARIVQVRFDHQLSRSWLSQQNLGALLAIKSTDYDSVFKDPSLERDETSESLALNWNYTHQTDSGRFQQKWNIAAMSGRYEIDSVIDEPENFSKVNIFANFKQYFGSGNSRLSSIVNFSMRGQYSKTALPSFEKFLLTGAYGVRSLQPGFFAGDVGGIISLDWYFTRLIQIEPQRKLSVIPLIFIDVAHGEKLDIEGEVFDSATVSGIGFGLEVALKRNWSARLFASTEIDQKTDSGLELDSKGFFLQMNYRTM